METEKKKSLKWYDYFLLPPHMGPLSIDLGVRFGGGLSGSALGYIGGDSTGTAAHSVNVGNGINFGAGAYIAWKKLMFDYDIDYHRITSARQSSNDVNPVQDNTVSKVTNTENKEKDITKTTIYNASELTMGLTWNREPKVFDYGYFYGGLKTASINQDDTSSLNNDTTKYISKFIGGVIGLRGIKSASFPKKEVSFIYYGSLFLSLGTINSIETTIKQNEVVVNEVLVNSSNSFLAYGIGAEQGFGISINRLGLLVMLKARSDIFFGIGKSLEVNSGSYSIYSVAWPVSVTLTATKNIAF